MQEGESIARSKCEEARARGSVRGKGGKGSQCDKQVREGESSARSKSGRGSQLQEAKAGGRVRGKDGQGSKCKKQGREEV